MNNKNHLKFINELNKNIKKHEELYDKTLEKVISFIYSFVKKYDLENKQINWSNSKNKELDKSLKDLFNSITKNELSLFKKGVLLTLLSVKDDLIDDEGEKIEPLIEEEIEELIEEPDNEGLTSDERLSTTYALFYIGVIGALKSLNSYDVNNGNYKTNKVDLTVDKVTKMFNLRKSKLNTYYTAYTSNTLVKSILDDYNNEQLYKFKAFPRCCDKCKRINGSIDTYHNFLDKYSGHFPIHPNCRCILVKVNSNNNK